MILDKSYVQSAKSSDVEELAINNDLYLTEAFLYEVIKNDNKNRSTFLKKLSNQNGEPLYKILPNANIMLLHEVNEKKPTFQDYMSFVNERDYSIHSSLADENYDLTEEYTAVLEKMRETVNNGTLSLFSHIRSFGKMYDYLITEAKSKNVDLEEFIVSDFAVKYIGVVLKFGFDKDMEREKKTERFPEIKDLNEAWFIYRFIQVYNLISLDIISRYPDLTVLLNSKKSVEKLRHDYLDLEYLLWAVSFKAFQTKENKLNRWYNLLTSNSS
ncbi:hypothetical protein GCS57_003546 [Vibrio cholerae]|nr:hypothetical protein [Vibrio vulnificus]